jgi:ribosomal protein L34
MFSSSCIEAEQSTMTLTNRSASGRTRLRMSTRGSPVISKRRRRERSTLPPDSSCLRLLITVPVCPRMGPQLIRGSGDLSTQGQFARVVSVESGERLDPIKMVGIRRG